jgi:RimJ/RimL family protein N-acetyltransferase
MYATYTGERTRLRPLASRDEAMSIHSQIRRLPNEYWGPGWYPREEVAKQYDEKGGLCGASGENMFAVERLDSGEVIGFEFCGLWGPGSIAGWFGTNIAPEHRGLGFGIEAKLLMLCFLFENYPVNHVGSDTVADHWPARRGMEACGMTQEGLLKGRLLRAGLYYDVVWYGILRRDWEKLPIRQVVTRG